MALTLDCVADSRSVLPIISSLIGRCSLGSLFKNHKPGLWACDRAYYNESCTLLLWHSILNPTYLVPGLPYCLLPTLTSVYLQLCYCLPHALLLAATCPATGYTLHAYCYWLHTCCNISPCQIPEDHRYPSVCCASWLETIKLCIKPWGNQVLLGLLGLREQSLLQYLAIFSDLWFWSSYYKHNSYLSHLFHFIAFSGTYVHSLKTKTYSISFWDPPLHHSPFQQLFSPAHCCQRPLQEVKPPFKLFVTQNSFLHVSSN